MSRETVPEKALRYLGDGRLKLKHVSDKLIVANCEGDHGVYALGYDTRAGDWRCECPARRHCAHLTALALVVERPR